MFRVLDRLMIGSYIKSYAICLTSILGLYIVVDLFMNVNDFAQEKDGLVPFLRHVGIWYGAQSTVIFNRLSEMIVLCAAMFTIAWVQRNNELLPQLSAGVSIQRIVRPVLLSACGMLVFSVLNQELLIPRLSSILSMTRDDMHGDKKLGIHPGYEPNGIYLTGSTGNRKELTIEDFHCNIKPPIALGNVVDLHAPEARYVPPSPDGKRHTGGWIITGAPQTDFTQLTANDVLETISPTKYFLKTQEVDFDYLTRNEQKWFYLSPTWRLYQELCKSDVQRLAAMAVQFHMRMTRPVLGMILVILGLSVILRDQNRNLFISAGLCLGLCAIFFAAGFACQQLGEKDLISPTLAAWLPVIIFGPLAFVMFDAIHT
jgi:lipopolysaccharide export system permease protein